METNINKKSLSQFLYIHLPKFQLRYCREKKKRSLSFFFLHNLLDYAHQRVLLSNLKTTINMKDPYHSNYVMLQHNGSLGTPHYKGKPPVYSGPKSSRSSICFRCMCCCYCCLFLIIFMAAAATFLLYTCYKPVMPKYGMDNFSVNTFTVNEYSIAIELVVDVTAENPNAHIGFSYGQDNFVHIFYSGTKLCSGKFPSFYQPKKNVTVVKIVLKGNHEFDSELQEQLKLSTESGKFPVIISVKVPVRVVAGILTLPEVTLKQVVAYVNGTLVLDNMTPNRKTNILSSNYAYDFEL